MSCVLIILNRTMMRMYLMIIGSILLSVYGQEPPPYNGTCVNGTYPPDSSLRVSEYTVNLDLLPAQRWAEIGKAKKNEINTLLTQFKTFLKEFGSFGKELIKLLDESGEILDSIVPHPYHDEIKGLALATGLNLGELVLYNIFYDVSTLCTSIVAQDSKGKLYHGRNLDLGFPFGWDTQNKTWALTEALRPTIVNVIYQKGGKTVFKAVHFAGYVGILTGVSPSKFTLSLDSRFNMESNGLGIKTWLKMLKSGKASFMGFLTRETMEKAETYKQAQTMLANTPMRVPAYFILGGTRNGEASVITRNKEVAGTDIWKMTDKTAGEWYILETNYDHWKKPMIIDDRRGPANRCMHAKTQKNIGIAGLFDVLSSKPVLNLATTYTALMQVDTGHLETWLQYCENPCMPF